jgi:hypothetical protein
VAGTGLGLALVRSIARGHCGEVRVRSTPGTGSRFDLMLPAMMAAGERPAAVPASAMMAGDCPAAVPAPARAGQPRGSWTRQ